VYRWTDAPQKKEPIMVVAHERAMSPSFLCLGSTLSWGSITPYGGTGLRKNW